MRSRFALPIGAAFVLAIVTVSEVATMRAVQDLDRRVDRLGVSAATIHSQATAASDASEFCLSYPLVGRLTIDTSSQASKYLGGDIAGFPADHDVSVELWDTTLIPSRLVHRVSFRADAYGAVHLGELSIGSSSNITRVF